MEETKSQEPIVDDAPAYNAKEELDALHAPPLPRIPLRARVKAFFDRFRLFRRLRLAEQRLAEVEGGLTSLRSALTYCADCKGVLFGINEKNVLTFEGGNKALFCNWCVQKHRARALQEGRRHARRG